MSKIFPVQSNTESLLAAVIEGEQLYEHLCLCLHWSIDRMRKVVKPKNGKLILDSSWSAVHGLNYKADRLSEKMEAKKTQL